MYWFVFWVVTRRESLLVSVVPRDDLKLNLKLKRAPRRRTTPFDDDERAMTVMVTRAVVVRGGATLARVEGGATRGMGWMATSCSRRRRKRTTTTMTTTMGGDPGRGTTMTMMTRARAYASGRDVDGGSSVVGRSVGFGGARRRWWTRTTAGAGRRGATTTTRGGGGGGGGAGGGGGGDGGGGGQSSGGNGGVRALWAAYLNALEKNPLATKCATSGVLNALGDLFAQFAFDDAAKNGIDWRRAGIFTFLGGFLVGPTLHFWYSTLGRIVTAQGSAKAFISLVLDQGVFAPAFLCVFLSSLFTIEGKAHEIVPKLKQDFASTVTANWNIWIPFQYLNFRFVPLNLQVAAANVVALLWNTYLSWASHKEVVAVQESGGKKKR